MRSPISDVPGARPDGALTLSASRNARGLRLVALSLGLIVASGCNCGDRLARSRAQIKLDPASLDFGTQPAGASIQKSVTISNEGTARLTIEDAHFEDDARSAFTVSGMPEGIDPGGSAIVAITYLAPQLEGPDGASLLISSDADNAPETRLSVSGRSVQSCGIGSIACTSGCVNPMTDMQNCGTCGNVCGADEACTNGGCVCVPKTCAQLQTACGMQSDGCGGMLDCGGCGSNATCMDGACVCNGGATSETACGDGVDDDCDGKTDCQDPDCAGDSACSACLPGNDVRVTNDSVENLGTAVTWTGTHLGIIWQQSGAQPWSYGFAQITDDGTISDAPHDITSPPASVAHPPTIDWTGSGFGLAWSDIRNAAAQMSNDVYFGAMDANGVRTVGDIQLVGGPQLSFLAAIAWNPKTSEHGVVWTDSRDTPMTNDSEIYFARVDGTGAKIGSDVRVTNAPGWADFPSIAVAPTGEYGIAFTDNRSGNNEIYFVVLDQNGTRINTTDLQLSASGVGAWTPNVTFGQGQFAVVWADARNGNEEAYFRRVSLTGTANGPEVRVTNALGKVRTPRIVSNGTGWGTTWSDSRSGVERVYFNALSLDGNAPKPEVALTCTGAPALTPSIAWTGTQYAVAWGDLRNGGTTHEIYARFFNAP